MKEDISVSKLTVARLALYFRELLQLQRESIHVISSAKLGLRIDITPEQIRKDLTAFGEFGKKGVGYSVDKLLWHIAEILGVRRRWGVAIVGFGHLGGALANHKNFTAEGFKLAAIFDNSPAKIGVKIGGIKISDINDLNEVVQECGIQIGIITVPAFEAQYIADKLIAAGVLGIWNFAPVKLRVPDNIHLIEEDPTVGLSRLSYYVSQTYEGKKAVGCI